MSSAMSKVTRLRMAETGEKYTKALRYLQEHPDEEARLREVLRAERETGKEQEQGEQEKEDAES